MLHDRIACPHHSGLRACLALGEQLTLRHDGQVSSEEKPKRRFPERHLALRVRA